jgi:hypothetical protein
MPAALVSANAFPPTRQVHYLGDPNRGSVWEEVIINCPRHIQLLCMSATVANPQDLGDWIAKVWQWLGGTLDSARGVWGRHEDAWDRWLLLARVPLTHAWQRA